VLSRDGSSENLLAAEYDETNAEISPSASYLAYESNESGRNEIYVRPFPDVEGGRWQVSTNGGTQPLWARDGQELFYWAPSGELVAVRVRTGPSFTSGKAEVLFGERSYHVGRFGRTYDISRDGTRFLMIKDDSPGAGTRELMVVLNWFEELERLVPDGELKRRLSDLSGGSRLNEIRECPASERANYVQNEFVRISPTTRSPNPLAMADQVSVLVDCQRVST